MPLPDKKDHYTYADSLAVEEEFFEVLSPETVKYDCFIKLELYQRAGVREYWIVDPETRTVKVFILDDEGIYHTAKAYKQTDVLKVNVLNGCFIELSKVFPDD